MRRFWQLSIAVLGNALGTALMDSSNMGLTAWGIGAKNLSLYFDVSLGFGFIILSIFFYSISVIIRKKFILREFIESFAFLFAFSIFTNYFATIMPDIRSWNFIIRLFNYDFIYKISKIFSHPGVNCDIVICFRTDELV